MAKAPTQIRSLARSHTETALNVLVGIMNKEDAPEASRVAAANGVLDRGWGKPPQAIVGGDDEDSPIRLETIRRIIVKPSGSGHSDSGSVPAAT